MIKTFRSLAVVAVALLASPAAHADAVLGNGSPLPGLPTNSNGSGVAAQPSVLRRIGNIGTHIWTDTYSDVTLAGGATTEVLAGLPQDFDAIKVILGTGWATGGNGTPAALCSATVVPDPSDASLNVASWSNFTFNNAGTVTLPAPISTHQRAWTYSDTLVKPSVPRTDGGVAPLLALRCYQAGNASPVTIAGAAGKNYDGLATHASGRIWRMRRAINDNYASVKQAQFTGSTITGTPTVGSGGTGYAVGDTCTLPPGISGTPAKLTVASLSGSAVATWTRTVNDIYATPAGAGTNPVACATATGTGSGATAIVNYASVAPASQNSLIVGYVAYYRGNVVSQLRVGDSITEAQATIPTTGWGLDAAIANSDKAGTVVEDVNMGRAGATSSTYTTDALDFLAAANAAGALPDIMMIPAYSPNDNVAGPLTAAGYAAGRANAMLAIAQARNLGLVPVIWTGFPTNYVLRPYGTSDQVRLDGNKEVLSYAARGLRVMDFAPILSGPIDGNGQTTLLYSNDNIHPNDAGNALLVAPVAAMTRSIMGTSR